MTTMGKLQKLRVSDISAQDLESFLRLGQCDEGERRFLEQLLVAATSYLCSATGLTAEQVDGHSEFVYAAMVLVSHMYDNRSFYVGADYSNHMVQHVINLHRVNYA